MQDHGSDAETMSALYEPGRRGERAMRALDGESEDNGFTGVSTMPTRRALADVSPYLEWGEQEDWGDPGPCIACIYKGKRTASDAAGMVDEKDRNDAYEDMIRLITENYGKGISNKVLVDMVHEFYEDQIRKYWDYGKWSKKCIWYHILFHMNDHRVAMNEGGQALLAQIESLRTQAWHMDPDSGVVAPNLPNLKLMESFVRSHNQIACERVKAKQ